MGLFDTRIVKHMGVVVGHVGEAVTGLGNAGFADTPIVEDDGAKRLRKERHLSGPEAEIVARAADQNQRRAVSVDFVVDRDTVAWRGHGHIGAPVFFRAQNETVPTSAATVPGLPVMHEY